MRLKYNDYHSQPSTTTHGSKFRRINLAENASKRLKQAGFKDVKKAHYGLLARK